MFIRWLANLFEVEFRGSPGPVRKPSGMPKAGSVAALHATAAGRARIEATPPRGSFRAMSIAPSVPCCGAVATQLGRRYLLGDQPPLPLEQCVMPARCCCRHEAHADRRKGERRVPGIVWPRMKLEGVDRRRAGGRRRTDRAS